MEFLLIGVAHFLALLSPGPDFFLILQASVRLPKRYGVAICAGISAANGVYLCFAVLGLEIVRELSWLMVVLKYLGAGYLVFLGIMLLTTKAQTFDQEEPGNFLAVHHIGKQFLIGFMSGILNPKNAIFYLSLFTVMVSEETSFGVRCLYGLWMTAVVFIWDFGVVMVLGRDSIKRWLGRGIYYVEKMSGLVLTVFGVMLPFI